mgnify:CR=1 FL=1
MRTFSVRSLFFFLMIMLSLIGSHWAEAADSFTPLSVKLTVDEPAGLARTQEPVTTGIPLPKNANIFDSNTLRIVGADGVTTIPAQFQVISRWDGLISDTTKPIKWVLVDFQADVVANATATYYLKDGGTGTAMSGITTTATAGQFSISTGAATITINRNNFNLFDTVNLGGGNIVSNPANDGFVFTDKNGNQYNASKITPLDSSVETYGPIHTVVTLHGKLSNGTATLKGGDASKYLDPEVNYQYADTAQNYEMEYRTRIHFYKNKSYVIVENTLINDGNGFPGFSSGEDNNIYIKSLSINTTVNLGASRQISFQGYTDTTSNLNDSYKFSQGHSMVSTSNEGKNFSFSSTKNSGAVGTNGTRAAGYADFGDGSNGVTVAMKYFWQQYPKAFRITGNAISADLLPDIGANHFMRGGWYITNELLYNFHTGSYASSGTANLVTAFQNNLSVRADPAWFADTQSFGLVAPAGLVNSDGSIQDAMNRFEQLQRIKYNAAESSNNESINTYKENRTMFGTNPSDRAWYGWDTFGSIRKGFNSTVGFIPPWQSGMQYDWPFSMLLHYLRTGNRGFYDLWSEMVNHTTSLDLNHGTLPGIWPWLKYMAFFEDGGPHATPNVYAGLDDQNQGFCLSYLITGKQRFLEACKGSADSGWTYWNGYQSTAPDYIKSELRFYGWNILRQLSYYKVSGDATYLNQALTIFTNGILIAEAQSPPPNGIGSNGKGYVYDPLGSGDCNPGGVGGGVRILMEGYITDPLVELHRLTQNTSVLAFLQRMLNFVKNSTFVGGTTNSSGNYLPYQTPYCYNPATGAREFRDIQPIYNYFFASGYAYLYAITQDPIYLDFSRNLFKDSVFYWDQPSNTYINPTSKTPIYLSYEPQTSKQHGWIGRFHQGYLSMEYQLQKNGGTLPAWYPFSPPATGVATNPPSPPTRLR